MGFALHSGALRGKDPLPCDILFCALHDWPGCPIPVLVATHVLGERATAQGVPLEVAGRENTASGSEAIRNPE